MGPRRDPDTAWRGFAGAETRIDCSGAEHRLRWDRGELLALDHDDPDAERALAALGGEPCTCVEQVDCWARHATDLRLLVAGSRGTNDAIPPPIQPEPGMGAPQLRARRLPGNPPTASRASAPMIFATRGGGVRPEGDDEAQRLATLLSLGGGVARRLLATVAAHWQSRLEASTDAELSAGLPQLEATPDTELSDGLPQLEAALYGRVLASLLAWLGPRAADLELELIPDGEPPSLRTGPGGELRARLPFRWLVDVWGRELEVFWGRFCLTATTSNGHDWELLSVGPELGEPAVIRVALPR